MAELRDRQVPLTVCPLSNCCLKVFHDMRDHNIKRLYDAGLNVTVNSDDPPYFGGYINDNYAAVKSTFDFTDYDIWKMARASFEAAFLPSDRKEAFLKELDGYKPQTDPRL